MLLDLRHSHPSLQLPKLPPQQQEPYMSCQQSHRFRRLAAIILSAASLLPLSLTVPTAQAQYVQQVAQGSGQVDWTAGTITVTGHGALPERGSAAQKRLLAQRAALVDGYRQLAEIIDGVKVDSETVVKDMVVASDKIRTQVSALVKGARTVATRNMSDGAVEVDVMIPMYGMSGLSAITAPVTVLAPQPIPAPPEVPSAAPAAVQPDPAEVQETASQPASLSHKAPPPPTRVLPAAAAQRYTGVIIDCRGLGAEPAMSPAILDGSGGEIYIGRQSMPDSFADFVIEHGIVSYARSLDEANRLERIGTNPLRLRASKVNGRFKADVVLGNDAAQQLVGAEAASRILSDTKVVFVL
jgi:hypothetical protein